MSVCSYCGQEKNLTGEHVLARSFFPDQKEYREDLIVVPSCASCNRAKNKFELHLPVWLQFADQNVRTATRQHLAGRTRRILRGNKKLGRDLAAGLSRKWVIDRGVWRNALTIAIGANDMALFRGWTRWLVRGFYRDEKQEPMPLEDHSVGVWIPKKGTDEGLVQEMEALLNSGNRSRRQFACGEFEYAFRHDVPDLSLWEFWFKTVLWFAVSVGPESADCRQSLSPDFRWCEGLPPRPRKRV